MEKNNVYYKKYLKYKNIYIESKKIGGFVVSQDAAAGRDHPFTKEESIKSDYLICTICSTNTPNYKLGCSHRICERCYAYLPTDKCPLCRKLIVYTFKLNVNTKMWNRTNIPQFQEEQRPRLVGYINREERYRREEAMRILTEQAAQREEMRRRRREEAMRVLTEQAAQLEAMPRQEAMPRE